MSSDETNTNAAKRSPDLSSDKDSCCGCSACYAVCPADAIRMAADDEGFLYPEIDGTKCIHCYQCEKVCAFKRDRKEKNYLQNGAEASAAEKGGWPSVYAVMHSSYEERMKSQSGGMFAALSEQMLEEGGVVYGCAFDDAFKAVHIRAKDRKSRDRLRYSKYVQSDMGDIFSEVEKDLKEGRKVLFSGTSCQVAGLKGFLKSRGNAGIENLFCTDLVCHGVPSPLVWADYLNWESKKAGSSPERVLCRDKKRYGWKAHIVSIWFKNGKRVSRRLFPKLFYSHKILRPSCYVCPYKSIHHPGDITIADFWADEQAVPGFRDNRGTSLVLINNESGRRNFEKCRDTLQVREAKLEVCMQKPLQAPYDAPEDRELFWKKYHESDFTRIAVEYGDYTYIKRLKWRIRELLRDLKK